MRPRLLDLFCGAGGAAMGYHRAGFEVVGVDLAPMPHYPFEFHQGDAIEYFSLHAHEFDAIHASPPCQDHSVSRNAHPGKSHGSAWLLGATRTLLEQSGKPWIIENVPGPPMRTDYRLCGCTFGLGGLRRERWFETSWRGFDMRPPCYHDGTTITVTGHGLQGREYAAGIHYTQADRCVAMGIDWMNRAELGQAIPPAYTEYLGGQLLEHLSGVTA